MILSKSSENTAVVFMYLPVPPEPSDNYNNVETLYGESANGSLGVNAEGLPDIERYERKLHEECPDRIQYLNVLKGFTEDLPPTVMVHGLKAVTSTLL